MSRQDVPNKMRGLRPAKPPLDLRRRTLGPAVAALERPPSRPDRWTGVWHSRAMRWAWAASMTLLLAGHVALTLRPAGDARAIENGPRLAAAAEAELADAVRLARIKPAPRLDGAEATKEEGS